MSLTPDPNAPLCNEVFEIALPIAVAVLGTCLFFTAGYAIYIRRQYSKCIKHRRTLDAEKGKSNRRSHHPHISDPRRFGRVYARFGTYHGHLRAQTSSTSRTISTHNNVQTTRSWSSLPRPILPRQNPSIYWPEASLSMPKLPGQPQSQLWPRSYSTHRLC